MKNLLFLFIVFGISLHSFGQDSKKIDPTNQQVQLLSPFETKAIKNVEELKTFMKVDVEMEKNLLQLFRSKNKMLYNATGIEERIASIKEGIAMKLEGLIGKSNFESIKSNPTLFNNLMN